MDCFFLQEVAQLSSDLKIIVTQESAELCQGRCNTIEDFLEFDSVDDTVLKDIFLCILSFKLFQEHSKGLIVEGVN